MTIILGAFAPLAVGEIVNKNFTTDLQRNLQTPAFRVIREATKEEWIACVEAYGGKVTAVDLAWFDGREHFYEVAMD